MSKQPPAKRKRVEPLAITGSPKLWFDDGSVVLQAQNTQFRVHCGVLSHSSVFCDMRRGLPQPPDQNVVEGCTVVVLTDSAVDVETLLETFHHPPFSVAAVPLFCIIAAQLRLGRKYKLRTPFIHASVRLGFTNPTKREQYVVAQKQRRSFDPSCVYNIFPHDGILFDTLTLARENKLLSALPCAYYRVVAKHSQTSKYVFWRVPSSYRLNLSPVTDSGGAFGKMFDDDWGDNREECQAARAKYQRNLMLDGEVQALLPLDFQEEYWETFGKIVPAAWIKRWTASQI